MVQHSGMESDDMGVTRQQLKSIVKECLVEILAEGIGAGVKTSINETKKKIHRNIHTSNSSISPQHNESKLKMQSLALKEAIRLESGGNNIMESILTDTAEKTLPAMLENDRMKMPRITGKIENIVASHQPEELFGQETTSKWAQLAFAGIPKK